MKKTILLLGGLFLLVSLAACGTKQSDQKQTSSSASTKKSFTYAIDSDPSSLNPINTSDRWGLTVTNLIYSPLVRIEADGTQKNELAQKVETAADGKSVTVKLKKNIKWSDGKPLTADDVVFTYEQKIKKENGNYDNLWIDDQPITVKKVDDQTVLFTLPQKSAAAVSNIVTETYIIPKHVYQNEQDFTANELKATPVGTGPYVLKEYKRGEYLRFEANPNYYGGKAGIKTLTLRIISNSNTAKVALQKGEVDAAVILPSDIKNLKGKAITAYPYSESRIGYMGLNTHSSKLSQVEVRQAILYALKKSDLNQAAYLDKKYYNTPTSILPPSNPYADKNVETYQTDVAKAKKLLKAAGVSNLNLTIGYNAADPAQTLQATLIQQQLQKVGVSVTLAGGDGTAVFTELRKAGQTKYDLFLGGYIMGNDPSQYSRLFVTGGASNYFQYSNTEVDQLFAKGLQELDQSKRKTIYNQLQAKLAKDAVIYPIVDNKKIIAINNRIKGVNQAKLISIYTFEDASKLTIQ